MGIRDIFAWSALSTFYHTDIESYCKCTCQRLKLTKQVQTFYEHLRNTSNFEHDFESVEYSYKWLYMTWVKLNSIFRVFITRSHIRELESPCYILRQFDRDLDRYVVELKNVNKVHVVVEFPRVPAGTYNIKLRMNSDSIFWPNDDNVLTQMRVAWQNDGDVDENENEKYALINDWVALRGMLTDAKSHQPIKGLRFHTCDVNSGWMDLSLDNFTKKRSGGVMFELKDLENVYWKSGIVFDYVELKRIDWSS